MKKWKSRVLKRLEDAFSRVNFMRRLDIAIGERHYYVDYMSMDYSFDDMWGNSYSYNAGKYVYVRLPYEESGEDEEIIAIGEKDFLDFLTRNFSVKEILKLQILEFNPFTF